jgi:hypothetical protein
MITRFRITSTDDTAAITAEYDVGPIEHLNCSGQGGWTDQIKLNDEDAAICRIRNCRTQASVSICGIREMNSTWTWSVISLNDEEGITFSQDDNGVTVNCDGAFTIEYESSVKSGIDDQIVGELWG